MKDLKERGLRSKVRQLSTGGTRGGVLFTQGPLFFILRNRFYLGEVKFKGEILPGPQPPLLDRDLFDAVQQRLSEQWAHRTTTRVRTRALLAGLLFDDAGHKMVSTYTKSGNNRHRYYVSAPSIRGASDESVGSVNRVPAEEIEAVISKAIIANASIDGVSQTETLPRETIERHVERIDVRKNQLAVHMKRSTYESEILSGDDANSSDDLHFQKARTIIVPWKKPSKLARQILLPANTPEHRARPMKAERRAVLVRAIGRGRLWLQEIVDGSETIESLADRQHCSLRHIYMTISLAFLSPTLVRTAIEGRFPRGIGVAALRDAPPEWSQQMKRLGLAPTGSIQSSD